MDTIKIALSGQVYGTSGLIYTFPSTLAQQPHQPWLLELPEDARQELRQVLCPGIVARCYAIWNSGEGYYYALLQPHEGGYAVATVNTGDKVISDGTLVQDILEQLMDYFLGLPGAQAIDSTYVAGAANALRQALMSAPKPINNGAQEMAYRTFKNENENEDENPLADVLQYACQAEYANFKRVYVVDEKVTNTQSNYQRIVTKIKKTYQVNCPEGAVASDLELVDGQKLTVTYKKDGYRDIQKQVLAGQEADFCTVEGCYINVKPADELGLKFTRSFHMQVLGDNDREIAVFRIGQKEFSAAKSIGFPAREMDLIISADGYESATVHVNPQEMQHDDVVRVVLKAQMTDFELKINTGTETLSAPIKISASSPLYQYLVGLQGKAVAGSAAPVAPVVPEKQAEPEEKHKDPEYIPPTPPQFEDHSGDEEKPEPTHGGDTKQFFVIVGIILAIILVIGGLIGYRMGWFSGQEELQLVTTNPGDTIATAEVTTTEDTVEPVAAEPESASASQAGKYSYLDQHDTWKLDEAPTAEEKEFIGWFQQREVTKMIKSQQAQDIQNEKFKQIMTAIKAVPEDARRRVANIFEMHSKDNTINLDDMKAEVEKLAKEYTEKK